MGTTHTNLRFHIVFSTKYRQKKIVPQFREDMFSYIGGIIRDENGSLLEAGGIRDHVHLLFGIPPTIALSDLVGTIKGKSSRWLNKNHVRRSTFRWQEGYGGFSVSHSMVPEVKEYIQKQEQHHRKRTFEEEFLALLGHHDIDYDEAFLFDET